MPHASAGGNPAAQKWSRALGGRAPDRFARSRRTTRPALIAFSCEQPGLETRRGAPTERLRNPLHEKEISRAREQELPPPTMTVDRALHGREQLRFSLNLIED